MIRACSWCEVKVIGSKVMVKFMIIFSEKISYIRPRSSDLWSMSIVPVWHQRVFLVVTYTLLVWFKSNLVWWLRHPSKWTIFRKFLLKDICTSTIYYYSLLSMSPDYRSWWTKPVVDKQVSLGDQRFIFISVAHVGQFPLSFNQICYLWWDDG